MKGECPQKLSKDLTVSVLLMLCVISVAEARMELVPGSRFASGRGTALGDAFVPLVDDGAAALFYNPAGIGKVPGMHLEPLNFQIQTNSDYVAMIDRNLYKLYSLSGYLSNLTRKPDRWPGMGAALFPNFSARGMAFGILMQGEQMANATGSNVRYRSKYLFVPTFGACLRLASGVVRLGYSFQWVNQASGDLTVPDTTDPLGYNQGLAQGAAVSHNLGFAMTLPVTYLPAFNIVARNVLGAKFGSFTVVSMGKNTSGVPPTEPLSFDASLSGVSKAGMGLSFNMALVYRDFTNRSGMSLFGRLAAGVEFDFRNQFFIRGGWGSGYPSVGIGLKRRTADFSFSWYNEEVGTKYHEKKDTRYLLHYQIRAF